MARSGLWSWSTGAYAHSTGPATNLKACCPDPPSRLYGYWMLVWDASVPEPALLSRDEGRVTFLWDFAALPSALHTIGL